MKQKYNLTVGEPWNYDNEDGTNLISGHIQKVLSIRCIVFVSDSPLQFGALQGTILVLSSRYEVNKDFSDLDSLTVNGGVIEAFDETFSEEQLKERASFVLIGRLEKCEK